MYILGPCAKQCMNIMNNQPVLRAVLSSKCAQLASQTCTQRHLRSCSSRTQSQNITLLPRNLSNVCRALLPLLDVGEFNLASVILPAEQPLRLLPIGQLLVYQNQLTLTYVLKNCTEQLVQILNVYEWGQR